MNLSIHGRNVEITPFIREYVEKKIGRLDRYLPSLGEAKVDIRAQQTRNHDQRFVVQVTLYDTRGTILRGEEQATEIFPAVDTVVDKMHRQIVRFKGKQKDRFHRQNAAEPWGEEPPVEMPEETEAGELVRTKRFPVSPMSAEEAIDQMELLGHNFFVFFDAEQGSISVLYRRHDGNYGLIVPEMT